MKLLGNGAYLVQSSQGANGYAVPTGEGFALIDPGVSISARALLRELEAAELLERLHAVLLTHYDYDHAGAALAVGKAAGVPVIIGAEDAAVLRGERSPGTRFRKLLTAVGRPRLPENAVLLDGPGEPVPGIRAVPSPGHTPGHYAYLWSDTLFCGDAAMVRQDGTLKQFPGFLITDKAQALESAAQLTELRPSWICPGHGAVRKIHGVPG